MNCLIICIFMIFNIKLNLFFWFCFQFTNFIFRVQRVVEILKLVTCKNVAMSTTLIEINQMMLNNLRDVNHEIKNIILSILPKDLHSIVLQSFNQSKRLEALNSVKTITDILRVLKNDLVWIPPVLHCLDEDGKDIEDPCEEGEDFLLRSSIRRIHGSAYFADLNLGAQNLVDQTDLDPKH